VIKKIDFIKKEERKKEKRKKSYPFFLTTEYTERLIMSTTEEFLYESDSSTSRVVFCLNLINK